MTNFPPVPNINMADYPVDSDEEDIFIKDSNGTRTVAVIVQSEMRRLSAEKTRAAITSFPVLDAHNVRDDDVDEYNPILDRKGKNLEWAIQSRMELLAHKMVNVSSRDIFGRTSWIASKVTKNTIPSLRKGES